MNESETDTEVMTDEELLDTLCRLAVQADLNDNDLIGSCRRLNAQISWLKRLALAKLAGQTDDGEELLTSLMDAVVRKARIKRDILLKMAEPVLGTA